MSEVNSISTTRPGRRSGNSNTKAQIIRAAQQLFADRGLDQTTMRQIGSLAGVDPALIVHYFKNKQQLFAESMYTELYAHASTSILDALTTDQRMNIGERLARAFVGILTDDKQRMILLGAIRSAASDPKAAEILRNSVQRTLLDEVEKYIVGEDRRLRATLVGSQLIGIVMARYVARLEPLASASPEEIIRHLAPRLQEHFNEPSSSHSR